MHWAASPSLASMPSSAPPAPAPAAAVPSPADGGPDLLRASNNDGPSGGRHAHDHSPPSSGAGSEADADADAPTDDGAHTPAASMASALRASAHGSPDSQSAASGDSSYVDVPSQSGSSTSPHDGSRGGGSGSGSARTGSAVSAANTVDSASNSAGGGSNRASTGPGSAGGSGPRSLNSAAAQSASTLSTTMSTPDSSSVSLQQARPPVHRPVPRASYSRFRGALPTYQGQGRSILILLLRNDLRISDNPLFAYAHRAHAEPPPEWMGEQMMARAAQSQHGGLRFSQALWAPSLPSHSQQGINGGGVFAEEWNLASQAQYVLPLFVFDERVIELSGLPGYNREGPEARTPEYGFWKTGGFRIRFIVECIADLRQRLLARGSDLLLRFGKTESVLDELISSFTAQGDSVEAVWMQKEAASDDIALEGSIAKAVQSHNVPLNFSYNKTLIHPSDLPFDIKETPDVFTPFRKRVESLGKRMVRAVTDPPDHFKPFPPDINDSRNYSLTVDPRFDIYSSTNSSSPITAADMPPTYEAATSSSSKPSSAGEASQNDVFSWDDLMKALLHPVIQPQCVDALNDNATLTSRHPASAFPLRGGETSALERLDWYFVRGRMSSGPGCRDDLPPVARYKQTRNNLIGPGYSTKMSPFLAYGCISARQIWKVLDELEERIGEDQSTYWVRFELMWRDYFFLVAAKFGDLLYSLGGFETITDPRQAEKKLRTPDWWKTWDPVHDGRDNHITRLLEARTGIPFIDANITELRESGFMSNRGRQNIASFLSKDLGFDWRIGAEFFASQLIDYDASSNYGNWQYVAGVGNDPRASRQFNTIKQSKDYDARGEYVKTWLPVLRNLPAAYVHTPWLLSDDERWQYGVKPSQSDVTMHSYPSRPIIELESWRKHYDRRDGSGSKMRGNPQEKVKDITARFRKLRMYHSHQHAHNHNHSHAHNHDHHHHHYHLPSTPAGATNGSYSPVPNIPARPPVSDASSTSHWDLRSSSHMAPRTKTAAAGPQRSHLANASTSSLSSGSWTNGSSRSMSHHVPWVPSPSGTPVQLPVPAGAFPTPSAYRPTSWAAQAHPGAGASPLHYASPDAYDVMGTSHAGEFTSAPLPTHEPDLPSVGTTQSAVPSRWAYGRHTPTATGIVAPRPAVGPVGSSRPSRVDRDRSFSPAVGSDSPSSRLADPPLRPSMVSSHGGSDAPNWRSTANASFTTAKGARGTATASALGPGARSSVSISPNGTIFSSSSSGSRPSSAARHHYFDPRQVGFDYDETWGHS